MGKIKNFILEAEENDKFFLDNGYDFSVIEKENIWVK